MDNLSTGSSLISVPTTLPRTLKTLASWSNPPSFSVTSTPSCFSSVLAPIVNRRYPRAKPFESDVFSYAFSCTPSSSTNPKPQIISDRDWETRPIQEHYFWTRLQSVEVEKCKCIYLLLVDLLANLRPILSCNQPIARIFPNFKKSTQRGLPLLQQAISHLPLSPLASSYTKKFVNYGFTGLERVDPHDGNYFLPFKDFQS